MTGILTNARACWEDVMLNHIEDLEYDVRVQALYELTQTLEIDGIKAECYLKLAECQFHRGILALQVESPGFKKNPHVKYARNISKITNISERLKDCTLRKYNFVNSVNVKTDFKRYTELQGTTCVWKMQNIQQEFVLHAFKLDDELRNKLS